ncbi:MAG: DUF4434 domain-containing protein, partial [Lentisphaerota bacterium]
MMQLPAAMTVSSGIRTTNVPVPATKRCPEISLTLVPPSPVTDQITLDICGAVRNSQDTELVFDVSAYLDEEKNENRLHVEAIRIPAKSAGGIKFRWPTKGNKGKHMIILVADSARDTLRISRPLEILESRIRSTERIEGAWAGICHWSEEEGRHWNKDIRNLTDDDWRGIVRDMHSIGMNTILIQEVFRNDAYAGKHNIGKEGYKGLAYYPSRLFPGRMKIAAADPLEAIFDEADKLGTHVLPGIGLYAWFDYSPGSLEWHLKVADEIWEMYGHHPSFYGWKISEEGHGSLGSWNATEEENEKARNQLVEFFRNFGAHVRKFAPDKPVMVARNTYGLRGSEEAYRQLLPHLDILCSFCFHRMPDGEMTGEAAAEFLQKLCDEAGSHLWMDMEVFLFENGKDGGPLIPRPIAGLLSDLRRFPNFEKIFCYQYPGLMTH